MFSQVLLFIYLRRKCTIAVRCKNVEIILGCRHSRHTFCQNLLVSIVKLSDNVSCYDSPFRQDSLTTFSLKNLPRIGLWSKYKLRFSLLFTQFLTVEPVIYITECWKTFDFNLTKIQWNKRNRHHEWLRIDKKKNKNSANEQWTLCSILNLST